MYLIGLFFFLFIGPRSTATAGARRGPDHRAGGRQIPPGRSALTDTPGVFTYRQEYRYAWDA
jgi:hypothetical protein